MGYEKSSDYGVDTSKYSAKTWAGVALLGFVIFIGVGLIVFS